MKFDTPPRSIGPSTSALKNMPVDPKASAKPVLRYTYVGKEPQNLAGYGTIKNGDVITVSPEIGKALEQNAPDEFAALVGPELAAYIEAEKVKQASKGEKLRLAQVARTKAADAAVEAEALEQAAR